jgi:hypothetical protein
MRRPKQRHPSLTGAGLGIRGCAEKQGRCNSPWRQLNRIEAMQREEEIHRDDYDD